MANGNGSALTLEQLLALAQAQMAALLSGKATIEVETPNLGRVRFNQADVGSLQRYIDSLQALIAAQSGTTTVATLRRRPLSFEACP
jgi:hypothetical protein